jgi:hypothetical protein
MPLMGHPKQDMFISHRQAAVISTQRRTVHVYNFSITHMITIGGKA